MEIEDFINRLKILLFQSESLKDRCSAFINEQRWYTYRIVKSNRDELLRHYERRKRVKDSSGLEALGMNDLIENLKYVTSEEVYNVEIRYNDSESYTVCFDVELTKALGAVFFQKGKVVLINKSPEQ